MRVTVIIMQDAVIDRLSQLILHRRDHLDPSSRLLVGIAGIPGSGKSSLARHVSNRIESIRGPCCVTVSMDGWHYPRAVLDKMDDPETAYKRRGAAFTFDADAFVSFAQRLRQEGMNELFAPSFSHADKDPIYNDIHINDSHKIVLIEGLYCCLNLEPWRRAAECWDLRWFIDTSPTIARDRLIRRHIESGICPDKISAAKRADANDLLNGEWILAHIYEPVSYWHIPSWDALPTKS